MTGDDCSTRVPLSGIQVTGHAKVVSHEQVWVLLQAPDVGRFYIPVGKPVDVDANGNWSEFVGGIGEAKDAEKRFTLVVVAANLDAANTLARTYANPLDPKDGAYLEALPVGSRPAAQACLIRT